MGIVGADMGLGPTPILVHLFFFLSGRGITTNLERMGIVGAGTGYYKEAQERA